MSNYHEVSPPGWSGTVAAMQRHHPEIDNPWALAWSMKKKHDKPHYKAMKNKDPDNPEEPKKKEKYKDEDKPKHKKKKGQGFKEWFYESLEKDVYNEGLRDWFPRFVAMASIPVLMSLAPAFGIEPTSARDMEAMKQMILSQAKELPDETLSKLLQSAQTMRGYKRPVLQPPETPQAKLSRYRGVYQQGRAAQGLDPQGGSLYSPAK